MASLLPFRALTPADRRQRPLVVLDLGYSARRRTCGVAWGTDEPQKELMRFSDVAREVSLHVTPGAVLVLEAPLSTFHRNGNPDIRGSFEEGRAWYCGAGAAMALAAQRFLKDLALLQRDQGQVVLAEAFLSNKRAPTRHTDDATRILRKFWLTGPETPERGTEPVSDLIDGVPAIRVFDE